MSKVYRSHFEAYPFLADKPSDLRCDFELLTDSTASKIGMLRALCTEQLLRDELEKICELMYHCNPSLRTKVTIKSEEIAWLEACVYRLEKETVERRSRFLLPQGSERGCLAHMLRADCKDIVRLLYRHHYNGNEVSTLLLDFLNLLSGYFFMLAIKLNELDGVDEIKFISRNY